jgi:hypothetical protein
MTRIDEQLVFVHFATGTAHESEHEHRPSEGGPCAIIPWRLVKGNVTVCPECFA